MEFFTPVEELHFSQKIALHHKIVTIGSCFSESMGSRLERLPLKVLNQPMGTLFHPNSIIEVLSENTLREDDCYSLDGKYVHPHFHSKWKKDHINDLIQAIEQQKKALRNFLSQADWFIITFGTSFYYFDEILQIKVANCHKQPQKRFTKKLSRVSDMSNAWIETIQTLQIINPKLKFLFTVSPVRHTKDGIQNNQLSKSSLRLAVEEIRASTENTFYFPAFEYILDELRDYRFFKKDLIHPNEIAEDFIYEKLFKHLFTDELKEAALIHSKKEKLDGHQNKIGGSQ